MISTVATIIFYGIMVTAIIMGLLYVVLKLISKSIVETPAFLITGAILAILLVFQSSLMIAAIQVKSFATDAAALCSEYSLKDLEELPLIGSYIQDIDTGTYTSDIQDEISNIADSTYEIVSDYLNSYIWRRVFWIIGFVVVVCIVAAMFDKPNAVAGRNNASYDRHSGRRARTGSRQRVRRR